VVTLCTNPPQFFNGVGPTPDGASDDAAVEALRKLSEVGIEGLCGQSQTGLAVTEASARLVANFNLLIVDIHFICTMDTIFFLQVFPRGNRTKC